MMENLEPIVCHYEKAITIVGNRWTLMILKELHLNDGLLRFNELKKKLKPISSKTLSTKLKDLVEYKLVERKVYASVPVKVEYSLSERAYELKKILDLMASWSLKWYPSSQELVQ